MATGQEAVVGQSAPVARPKVDHFLFELGVSSADVQAVIDEKDFRELVTVYSHPSTATFIVKAPLKKHLVADTEYEFILKSEDYVEMVIINENTFIPIARDGNLFTVKAQGDEGHAPKSADGKVRTISGSRRKGLCCGVAEKKIV